MQGILVPGLPSGLRKAWYLVLVWIKMREQNQPAGEDLSVTVAWLIQGHCLDWCGLLHLGGWCGDTGAVRTLTKC